MRRIIELIKMPEWWFSAVFIAIIASVIAAFTKDWISRGLSFVSQAYKTRASLREAAREEKAAVLAAHPELLIIEFIRAVAQIILIGFLAALFISQPFVFKAAASPNSPPQTAQSFDLIRLVSPWISIAAGLVLNYIMYRHVRHLEICMRARKKLRSKLTGSNQTMQPTAGPSDA